MQSYYLADWKTIKELDDNLVVPTLKRVGAEVVGDKWRWDAQGYYIKYNGQEFYVNFEKCPSVEVYRSIGPYRGWGPCGGEPAIGIVTVKLPRKTWDSVHKKLQTILENV